MTLNKFGFYLNYWSAWTFIPDCSLNCWLIYHIPSSYFDGQIVACTDYMSLLFSGITWDEVCLKAIQDFKKVIIYLNHRKLSTNYNNYTL